MKRISVVLLLVALHVGTVPSLAAQEETETATKRIESFHANLIEGMKTNDDHSAREAHLKMPIEALFDVPTIARVSVGRKWRELDQAQRDKYVALLGEVVVATYADRFDAYNGQSFDTLETREVRNGEVVQTLIRRSNGTSVTLDYFFRNNRVFNVVADGVSDLSLRRADYSAIVKERGFEALLDHLVEQLAELRGQDA